MRSILLFFVFAFCKLAVGFSQADSVLVVFEFSDDTFKESIQNVNATLTISSKSKYRTSNSKGKIEIYIPNNSLISYKCNHAIYESVSGVKKVFLKELTDTFAISIEMVASKINSLKEIVIKAPGVPDTVFESKRLSVADFEVQQNGRLVLLTYPKQLRKGSELLLYDGLEVLNTFSVPGIAQELVRDYRGNAHVICEDNVYGLHINGQNIEISSLEKEYYLKYLAPILDTNRNKMFFSNFNKDYPAFEYYAFDQLDSTYSKIINIKDDLMMELYKSEYKWVDVRTKLWAKAKEHETGIEAEIWVGANYFTQSIYYKELYAPLFSKNDTIYVFDYYRDKLFSFDRVGNPLDSVAIYHHYQPKSTGWKKQLLQDKGTGEIYAVYDRSGYSYIGLIDPKTGEIKEQVRLEFRYVDKISIHDNFVYYIYRPFETAQKKFLYKERLPYNFGFAKVPYGTETSIETGK
jgi:ribosome-associated translation inhibitor RaiA